MIQYYLLEEFFMKNILIIEDDKGLSNGILLAIKETTINISQCFNLSSARDTIENTIFDLIILDINLPDGNGLDFLIEIKKKLNVPVILLTANDLEMDIVTGLESGADDYITKPFSLAILRARIHAQLRKHNLLGRYEYEDFIFDFNKMEFYKNSTSVELSKTEQKLLKILFENRGFTIPRNDLINRVWTDALEYVDENALSVTIKRLRDKLESDSKNPKYIKNVYGIGYLWAVK